VDLVELDVHLSRDDVVVVIHDPTLERTTSGQGPVRAQGWDALARLTLRGTAGEPVPRLAEVLDLLRPTPVGLLLEIKADAAGTPYPEIEERVLSQLRTAGLAARTAVMAFEWGTLGRLRRLDPGLRLTGLLGQPGALRVGGVPGAAQQLRALTVDDLGIERTLLSPAALAAARAAGRTIGVWTVNEPDELRTVLASGVDYVTTDRPDLALRLRAGT
jgi:glycerophosphoryl diester phosphodiesterase